MRLDWRGALVAFVASVAFGCAGDRAGNRDDAFVAVTANALGTQVAKIVITVEAADIAQPLVFNLTMQNGTATGTIRMPAGTDRTVTARAFESDGAISHEGSVTLPVVSRGMNAPVSIPMIQRSGQQPVTIVIGAVSVAVSPAEATAVIGEPLQLSAHVYAPDGQEVIVGPEWATTDPSVLAVSEAGVVTALREGQADVVATFAGVAGVSRITAVAAPPGVLCGNAVLDAGEGCDDGGTTPGDGCSAACAIEQGWTCTGQPSACTFRVCGDGVVEAGESCDDGGTATGDGCSFLCGIEPGWTCEGQPSACALQAFCGNGTVELGEQCDSAGGEGCSPSCTFDAALGVPGSVIFTEVMANPGASTDTAGEWIELLNVTGLTVDLGGCALYDNQAAFVLPPLVVAPDQLVVLGRSSDLLANGGVTVDVVFVGPQLSNSADVLGLLCGNEVVSTFAWSAVVNGVALQRDPATFGGDLGTWCDATTSYGLGDLGTPGAANTPCP